MATLYEQIRDNKLASAISELKALCALHKPNRSEFDYTGKVMYLDTKRPGIFDISETPERIEEAI